MNSLETHHHVVYNVKSSGATGHRHTNAQSFIQHTVDACAAAGGGVVYFPPGAYTTGTITLHDNLRIFIEAGATIYSSKNPADFPKQHGTSHALFYGADLTNITLEGRGTIDGQANYDERLMEGFQDWYIHPNQLRWEQAGRPLMRTFPTANSIGNLVLLVRCNDVRITGLTFTQSPSWAIHLWGCERLVIDGVYVHSSIRDGVWSDGIDPDGCRDVRISNCTIETGDDALVFYSSNLFGPARPCENITVTNCRLTSASSALKFVDGNLTSIRNVTIDNCLITGSNRGIAIMVFDGGTVENVILSNLVIECKRFDWFWWGNADPLHINLIRRSEIDPNVDKSIERPIGTIRNILIRNVFARGFGGCVIHGSAESMLENLTMDNVRLEIIADDNSPLQSSRAAVLIDNAINLRLRDFSINWEIPVAADFRSALTVENVHGLTLDGICAPPVPNSSAESAITLTKVSGLEIRNPIKV